MVSRSIKPRKLEIEAYDIQSATVGNQEFGLVQNECNLLEKVLTVHVSSTRRLGR
jgi:hypothetical protein